jgi:hypothetical protein
MPAEWGHAATSWEAADPTPGTPPTLAVLNFTSTPSGFVVTFNRPFDASELNLYDVEAGTFGPADVTLVGGTVGPITGSLVIELNSLTFIATAGPLPADDYTATLRSGADALQDPTGQPLDGDADGTPGGDLVRQFSQSPHDVVVSLPDFTRGPGQPVDVPAITFGWPLTLSDNRDVGGDIKSLTLTIDYDPAALSITGADLGPDAPANASLIADTSTAGLVTLLFSSSDTPLASGDSYIVTLTASVPAGAAYGSVHVVDLSGLLVTDLGDAPVDATADDAAQVAAYFGDSTGNGDYSGLDAQRVARVGVGLDSGFDAYPVVDPVIIADVTGNGELSGLDAQKIAQEAVGMDPLEIPPTGQPLRLSQPQQPGFSTPSPSDVNSPIRSTPEAELLTSTAQDSSRSRETSGDQIADAQTSGAGDTREGEAPAEPEARQRLDRSLAPPIYRASVDAALVTRIQVARTSVPAWQAASRPQFVHVHEPSEDRPTDNTPSLNTRRLSTSDVLDWLADEIEGSRLDHNELAPETIDKLFASL